LKRRRKKNTLGHEIADRHLSDPVDFDLPRLYPAAIPAE
jgi:hypothetical protein